MKLTGELKEKVEKAESAEQAKEIIEAAGVELSDDEVEAVAGGVFLRPNPVVKKPTPGSKVKPIL